MLRRGVSLRTEQGGAFSSGVRAIEAELRLPGAFTPDVLRAADDAAANPTLPVTDHTELPLVTVEAPGAADVDQALHVARRRGGYVVHYAVADIGAFVSPGGPIDEESHQRGVTVYAPDHRIPLYPPRLSEDAAAFIPGAVRPALLWRIALDESGDAVRIEVERSLVRIHASLDFETAQRQIDDGTAAESLSLIGEVGELLRHNEAERGGVSLPASVQEVTVGPEGPSVARGRVYPVERWTTQLSLLTGTECAEIMLYGEVGIVRRLPPPRHSAVARLRRTAMALGLEWRAEVVYADFVRSIDPSSPAGAAMLDGCLATLGSASYVAFDGGVPEDIEHAALATEYTHATAPLRRLVDRYAGEVAVALCTDRPIPDWVASGLRHLPKTMAEAEARTRDFQGAIANLVAVGVLSPRVGETFAAVVTDVEPQHPGTGVVMLREPAVEARVESGSGVLPLGEEVRVRLAEADPGTRVLRFELVS